MPGFVPAGDGPDGVDGADETDGADGVSEQVLFCKPNQVGTAFPKATASKTMISPTMADVIALLEAAIL